MTPVEADENNAEVVSNGFDLKICGWPMVVLAIRREALIMDEFLNRSVRVPSATLNKPEPVGFKE